MPFITLSGRDQKLNSSVIIFPRIMLVISIHTCGYNKTNQLINWINMGKVKISTNSPRLLIDSHSIFKFVLKNMSWIKSVWSGIKPSMLLTSTFAPPESELNCIVNDCYETRCLFIGQARTIRVWLSF